MGTIPAFGEPQDDTSVSASGVLKVLYMSHLALGDYIYQGPFLVGDALTIWQKHTAKTIKASFKIYLHVNFMPYKKFSLSGLRYFSISPDK